MAIKPEIEQLFEKEVVKVSDVSKLADVSRPTIYKWRKGSDISVAKEDDLLSAIAALTGKAAGTASSTTSTVDDLSDRVSHKDFGLLPEDLVTRLSTTISNALAQARTLNDLSRENPSSMSREHSTLRRSMRDARRLLDHVDEVCENAGLQAERGVSRW
ncbi:MAG: hypothetical protein AAGA47_05550 [Pseudomonadota bacterium]